MAGTVVTKRESLDWSEDDIKSIAEIAPAEVERAAVMWRTNAPDEAKDILDAEADL